MSSFFTEPLNHFSSAMMVQASINITIPESETTPAGILRFLIGENNVTTGDLRELGTDQLISQLLKGIREFDLKHIKYLCPLSLPHSFFTISASFNIVYSAGLPILIGNG